MNQWGATAEIVSKVLAEQYDRKWRRWRVWIQPQQFHPFGRCDHVLATRRATARAAAARWWDVSFESVSAADDDLFPLENK